MLVRLSVATGDDSSFVPHGIDTRSPFVRFLLGTYPNSATRAVDTGEVNRRETQCV